MACPPCLALAQEDTTTADFWGSLRQKYGAVTLPGADRYVREDDPWWVKVDWDKVMQIGQTLLDRYFAYRLSRDQARILALRGYPAMGISTNTLLLIGAGALLAYQYARRKG